MLQEIKTISCKYQLPCGWCELRNQLCNEFIINNAQQEMQKIIQPSVHDPVNGYNYECCKNCSNNPDNGGSGICNCVAPLLETESKSRYESLLNSDTTKYFKSDVDNKTREAGVIYATGV